MRIFTKYHAVSAVLILTACIASAYKFAIMASVLFAAAILLSVAGSFIPEKIDATTQAAVRGTVSGIKKKKKKKSKGKEAVKEDKKTFSDVAGLSEVKKDMKCLVDFLVHREKYESAGAKLPKGVILYGPPGTGKTLLAKAVAGEAEVPFHYMSGSEFIEMYVGVGAKRVRELFEEARNDAPCIVFIDEIDTIGASRDEGSPTGEDRKTINALLTEMDGFNSSEGILVIGATNRLEDLDKALMRPGRFTDKFCVNLPETPKERRDIIDLYIKDKNLDETVDLEALSKELIGFSPAKIEALLNEAAIISVRYRNGVIGRKEIDAAMYKLLLNGHEKENAPMRDKTEASIVSWHEAGHAVIGTLIGKEITKVTIISSTSGAGGVTFSVPREKKLLSRAEMEEEIMELYGGRAAELLLYHGDANCITAGASNDIERASVLIKDMVERYGFNEEFGPLFVKGEKYTKILKEEADMAKDLLDKTVLLLSEHIDELSMLANKLLKEETVTGEDVRNIVGQFNTKAA